MDAGLGNQVRLTALRDGNRKRMNHPGKMLRDRVLEQQHGREALYTCCAAPAVNLFQPVGGDAGAGLAVVRIDGSDWNDVYSSHRNTPCNFLSPWYYSTFARRLTMKNQRGTVKNSACRKRPDGTGHVRVFPKGLAARRFAVQIAPCGQARRQSPQRMHSGLLGVWWIGISSLHAFWHAPQPVHFSLSMRNR